MEHSFPQKYGNRGLSLLTSQEMGTSPASLFFHGRPPGSGTFSHNYGYCRDLPVGISDYPFFQTRGHNS